MQAFLVEAFVRQHVVLPVRIVLDLDCTDFVLHGHQWGRFFHGHYDAYCYLPLYVFCGDHPLLALLRPSNVDSSAGALKHLTRIVAQLRHAWPGVPVLVRGDSGFCREHLMRWCEDNGVDYLFGLAKNSRLRAAIEEELLLGNPVSAKQKRPRQSNPAKSACCIENGGDRQTCRVKAAGSRRL